LRIGAERRSGELATLESFRALCSDAPRRSRQLRISNDGSFRYQLTMMPTVSSSRNAPGTPKPKSIDTVVATNLHADILSDLAAALAGSLGIASTANLNPERGFPSMFEPIHGSAFDIMGKGIANPIATFWTASLMLRIWARRTPPSD
jgi:hypothetical protein